LFTPSTRWSYFWLLLCHLVVVVVVVFLFQTPPMSKPFSLWLALSPYPTSWTATKTRQCWQLQSLISNQQTSLIIFWFTHCFNTSQKSFKFRVNEILLSLSFWGFFQVKFQETIKKLQIHLVLGFFIPSFQMISITSWWSHYFLSFFSPK
jgi:hypothetical protein